MRVKVSRAVAIFADQGKLVSSNYLTQEQVALTDTSARIVLHCKEWRRVDDIAKLDLGISVDQSEQLVHTLTDAGVLVEEGSASHAAEERLRTWDLWGRSAPNFHFSSRNLLKTPFVAPIDDVSRLRDKAKESAHPPLEPVEIPCVKLSPTLLPELSERALAKPFGRVLGSRRTQRYFSDTQLSLESVSTFLTAVGRFVDHYSTPEGIPVARRTSPSAGCLQSIDLFVGVRDVQSLPSGAYRYLPSSHALTRLSSEPLPIDTMLPAQPYYHRAGLYLFYVANLERIQWKYDRARSYRSLLLETGHISQTAYLTATALDLGVAFVGAVNDEAIENYLGLDPATELVFGLSVVGHSAPSGDEETYRSLLGISPPPT